jgi:hypothetical protein
MDVVKIFKPGSDWVNLYKFCCIISILISLFPIYNINVSPLIPGDLKKKIMLLDEKHQDEVKR